jgi:DNA helicase-2/ATP-dependent DNA helicase PcrA
MNNTPNPVNRKRYYELPRIQDLSKDQERIHYLPDDGRYLVVGGPGTGKSVVCLLRARLMTKKRLKYIFLVFNKVLKAASLQLSPQILINTYLSWFKNVFQLLAARKPPQINPDDINSIDWNTCIDKLIDLYDENQTRSSGYDAVIVDEGQDMPKEFYLAIMAAGVADIFVAADQNQQITQHNSNRQDLQNALGVDVNDVIELRINYRNTYPVARFACCFYPDDPASPKLDLPEQKPSLDIPMLIAYGKNCRLGFEEVIARILLRVDRNPRELIGVITWSDKTREKYVNHFNQVNQSLPHDNGPIAVQTYSSKTDSQTNKKMLANLQFDQGGVMVFNANSCKGLEFDTVFIADIHEFPCRADTDSAKRRFYVMASRARERLFLLRDAQRHCPMETILPQDETILRRWSGS